jgi:hypothetical protein
MSFMGDLADMFPRTVSIEPYVSRTIAGLPSYGPAVSYPARIQMKDVGVRTLKGTVIIGRGTVYLPQIVTVTVLDRLTVPSGIPGPVQPPILSVSVNDDEDGGVYTSLVIG